MGITLDTICFDPAHTAVRETHEEVGGRRERVIVVSGAILGAESVASVHDALDAILAAASTADYSAQLSVRPGRVMAVRRAAFVREVQTEPLVGSFTLTLHARDPFEESAAARTVLWPVANSGATVLLLTDGTAPAPLHIRVRALSPLVNPAFSAAGDAIVYYGMLTSGDELVLDGRTGVALLNGADVTPYTLGNFPVVTPDSVTLAYTDDPAGSHSADVTIEYRDRWW